MHALRWLRAHDAGFWALRRAARTAIVMPALFALGSLVLHDPVLATFAAFGSFALLLLVDFTGPRRERVQALSCLALVGLLFICVGTAVSTVPVLAAVAMAVVAFAVLFAGVVSSVLASASTALLLAFVLPVATAGPLSGLPSRLAGWLLASVVAVLAAAYLWPAPARDPLRPALLDCCRLIAARLRADVAVLTARHALTAVTDGSGTSGPETVQQALAERDAAAATAAQSYAALHTAFYATPNRPTGLGTGSRTVIRLVDELGWLTGILAQTPQRPTVRPGYAAVAGVKAAAAQVLEQVAGTLGDGSNDSGGGEPAGLRQAMVDLRRAVTALEEAATVELPVLTGCRDGISVELVDALEPTFRAQEVASAVGSVGANAERAVLAERRTWWQRLLGHQPAGVGGPFAAARERAAAHLQPHSVWLHNSLRGGVGLGLAVLVADLTGVQHSFWVVLGTLSVLRSNALSTGQNIARGLLGTAAGIIIGGAIVVLIGTDRTLLWILLPFCVVIAGLAPAAISFAAGQAAFTVTLVILFNIVEPVGYRVGLVRIEDIAIGCGVSLVVGLLFWPRGAASALGRALAEAYQAAAVYLRSAVDHAVRRCAGVPELPAPPIADATAAAAAARRLDDAFREYLAERGGKQLRLGEVASVITGVIAPRLAADSVLELWQREPGASCGDRIAAGAELTGAADRLVAWYRAFADALVSSAPLPAPDRRDSGGDERLIAAVRRDLTDHAELTTTTAVRMIWTGEHLDAIRRLQRSLSEPALVVARPSRSKGSGSAGKSREKGRIG